MNYIYILFSNKDKRTYVGSTTDLNRRLSEHQTGKVKATKYRRPLILIYYEKYVSLKEARKREKYLKSSAGRKFIKKNNIVKYNGE
ncbi:MAG: hypothetical protein A2233_00970 [Candidatus Kerfeldbacteria bacterium RIFOXYA2_FULL_38_24]|uniref:GIY-YIG domain-containing protein n=1 Tax=Candidatus Kerfeldbacteria bacterium RIFOXYB2_FULL_38_14 TaxID=1798547 RepID=A0A1G2BG39_9BACT|nr:MAG: hypothetical protein A2233_00970 [Candidatus Kerfeldbacteria bacterium RIFOXYA2_FULL_38_24]OGY88124.1 MAG: hypothetical protein A2319_01700 [Candidatus Kerfeldbacteria bacterium RIFOXYB2_FULL_38_14]OGY89606.1 MAG: hypothetical protein A2458_04165 [Candidatus Kerfeldbacteria bacterium RIFOXYC2_FULL_38_9]